MTAVAPPLNFQPSSRTGWSAPNGATNGLNSMSADDYSRMFMPRKTVPRSNSSSSLTSSTSSTSTISASSVQTNSSSASTAGDSAGWGTRKKPPRGLWPPPKSEPISGISTARPQSIASSSSGASAASAISALQQPNGLLPSQHMAQSQAQQNGAPRPQAQDGRTAILHLAPMNGTFTRKTIQVPFFPDVVRIGRQTNNKTVPTETNGYFDSKVLSRQHAEIWADPSGKIFIRDVKSSNGTFVNGHRLSAENRDSEPHELHEQDMLELGIDIVSEDQKTIVHHKVAAKVEHAGIYNSNGTNVSDINFGDLDASLNGGMVGQGMGQMRGRAGSQGSMVNGRLGSTAGNVAGGQVNGVGQPRPNQFWLQPITMEQVVKRINAEIKQAKQQSLDLKRTSEYIDGLLAAEPKKETKMSLNGPVKSVKADLKARFSEPPAPPPQQPLPEKPDVAPAVLNSVIQPPLRRTDAERPKSNSSPVKQEPSQQISMLAEALSNARKEIESHVTQVKSLEELITQERLARENAEERARKLEQELRGEKEDSIRVENEASPQTIGQVDGIDQSSGDQRTGDASANEKPSVAADELNARLQQRLEQMQHEMSEMKQLVEQYRQRAENAERQSEKDSKTLAEMVEQIRQEEAERAARKSSKSRRSSNASRVSPINLDRARENGAIAAPEDEDVRGDLRRYVQNGSIKKPEQAVVKEAGGTLLHRPSATDQLSQAAPFFSMVAVVVLGVGWMAYLNSWPKSES